jgi:hypothetical protein
MKDLISQIELRFTILLAIGMFFPVLMATYFSISGGTPTDQQNAFVFYPLVGFYILGFVALELSKLFTPIKALLQILNWTLLLGIACFAMPTTFTIVAHGPIPFPNHWSYQMDIWLYATSMYGIVSLPTTIFFLCMTILFLGFFATVFPSWNQKPIRELLSWFWRKHTPTQIHPTKGQGGSIA